MLYLIKLNFALCYLKLCGRVLFTISLITLKQKHNTHSHYYKEIVAFYDVVHSISLNCKKMGKVAKSLTQVTHRRFYYKNTNDK